ncbi:MAG: RsmE family RNA methyltransferase [bacterium]
MPIYFIQDDNISGDLISIDGDNFHHLAHVLRCSAGEEIFASDNKEKFRVKIESVHKRHIEARVIKREKIRPGAEITLIQCLPKKDKMDSIVRHVVELGARNIFPVVSARSVPRVNDSKAQKLLSRFQKIANEQAQQAGIEILPNIYAIQKFEDAVRDLSRFDLVVIPWEEEKSKKVRDVLSKGDPAGRPYLNVKKLAIIIGPEGGLTSEEVRCAEEAGAISVSLGGTILRAEIAGLVTLAVIKYEFNWM